MSNRYATSFWLVSLFLAAGELVHAQSVIRRQGTELQVNSHTIENQLAPELASDGDGDFVVTWTSRWQDGAASGVFARRFTSAGAPQGLDFQVNSYTKGYQGYPDIVAETNGDFVVAWQSFNQDGFGYGVFARRFDSAGAALAAEFKVNTYTPGYQSRASVASDGDGDFVVAWESTGGLGGAYQGVFARRFSSTGAALAVEFQVNTFTVLLQYGPEVAIDGDGDFVIAWEAFNHDGQGFGVFAQRFSAAGVAQGPEFQVNTYTTNNQYLPTVAADVNGNFVVAWQSFNQDGVFPDGNLGIFARRFNSAGVGQAIEFQVNLRTTGAQHFPQIAADDSGDFVVTWESVNQDGSYEGVFARGFSASGSAVGGEFQVNAYSVFSQGEQSVGWDSDGDFVIAWRNEADQDGNASGVFAQRFSLLPLVTLDIDGNGLLGPLTDGLLVLRHFFGFTGDTLISGAIGADCTRCTAGDVSGYISGLGLTLDIDGSNTPPDPLTDGLLVLRYLFGFTGTTLTGGAVGSMCSRCDATMIVPYLQMLVTPTTAAATDTPTPTATGTPVLTLTPTATGTPITSTPTSTATGEASSTPTVTPTNSPIDPPADTPTNMPVDTPMSEASFHTDGDDHTDDGRNLTPKDSVANLPSLRFAGAGSARS